MSASDPESAFRVLPERRVEFIGRQFESRVVGLVHARDDERYLNQLGNGRAGAAPMECRPTSRPAPC